MKRRLFIGGLLTTPLLALSKEKKPPEDKKYIFPDQDNMGNVYYDRSEDKFYEKTGESKHGFYLWEEMSFDTKGHLNRIQKFDKNGKVIGWE